MKRKRKIEWTLNASKDLKEVLSWYKKKSNTGYKLVREALFDSLSKIAEQPFIFESDRLREPPDVNVRSFTVYHTRVSYYVSETIVTVLRVRHSSREPLID